MGWRQEDRRQHGGTNLEETGGQALPCPKKHKRSRGQGVRQRTSWQERRGSLPRTQHAAARTHARCTWRAAAAAAAARPLLLLVGVLVEDVDAQLLADCAACLGRAGGACGRERQGEQRRQLNGKRGKTASLPLSSGASMCSQSAEKRGTPSFAMHIISNVAIMLVSLGSALAPPRKQAHPPPEALPSSS